MVQGKNALIHQSLEEVQELFDGWRHNKKHRETIRFLSCDAGCFFITDSMEISAG